VFGDRALDRPCRPCRQFEQQFGGRHQDIDNSRLDNRVAAGPWQFAVDLCDKRARPIAACRCSMPSPALYRPASSGPLPR
jgi:hypothetical protein